MTRDAGAVSAQIIETASEWFVAMRDPEVSDAQRAGFAEWLRMSPVHVRVYLEVAKLWVDSSQVSAEYDPEAKHFLPDNVVTLQMQPPIKPARRSRYAVAASSIAATVLLGVLAGWWYSNRSPVYVAEVGETRVLTLEDGSIVRLNSRSRLKVHLTPELRSVELIDGQALFEVSKDPARPFIVRSQDATVRAVGTQFNVYRKKTGTVVTVVEGRVAVARAGEMDHETPRLATIDPARTMLISAGEQVTVDARGSFDRAVRPNVPAATSWLQQELVFNDRPLQEVLEEFNRYTRVAIVLDDPSLADLRINAVFHVTETESLLKFISRIEGVKVDRTSDEIRISRQPSAVSAPRPSEK